MIYFKKYLGSFFVKPNIAKNIKLKILVYSTFQLDYRYLSIINI